MQSDAGGVRYRLARATDAAHIAALHADSWRRFYRGMFPDEYLDNDVEADRATVWHERFNRADPQPATLTVLAELGDDLVGFAHSIVDEDPEWGTLLDNLHIRHDAQRLGIGTRLMAETATWLRDSGNTSTLYLWVLEANTRARRFYEALGGQPAGEGISSDGGSNAPSLRIWWPLLALLSKHLLEKHQASAARQDLWRRPDRMSQTLRLAQGDDVFA